MAAASILIPYAPRARFIPYHLRRQRYAKIVAHRRFGKTVGTVNDLIARAAENTRAHPPPRYAYVGPTYGQAKDVAWAYLKHYTSVIPNLDYSDGELWVELPHNRARIRIYGADAYDRLRGLYHDGIVLDEPALMDPRAWPQVIRPTLSDFEGWASFIGTPEGRNWFYHLGRLPSGELDPEFFHLVLRASETGILPEKELEDARRLLTPEQYEQEYECSFDAAILGAYFGKEIADAEAQGRICDVAPDPALPVHTAWDLGIGDSTAIWCFQMVGSEIRIIDHYENHGQGLGHYAAELEARGYTYGNDYVPHDAKARDLSTGRTRIETMFSLGRKPVLVASHKVMDGINAARLSLPRVWFDHAKCSKGIEALRQYRTDYDEKAKVFKNEPKHDWTSHSADAFRYLCMAWREMAQPKEPEPPKLIDKPLLAMTTWDQFHSAKPQQRRPARV